MLHYFDYARNNFEISIHPLTAPFLRLTFTILTAIKELIDQGHTVIPNNRSPLRLHPEETTIPVIACLTVDLILPAPVIANDWPGFDWCTCTPSSSSIRLSTTCRTRVEPDYRQSIPCVDGKRRRTTYAPEKTEQDAIQWMHSDVKSTSQPSDLHRLEVHTTNPYQVFITTHISWLLKKRKNMSFHED